VDYDPIKSLIILHLYFLEQEGIAKFVLEAKFDDFGAILGSCKQTYPIGHKMFTRIPKRSQKRELGAPRWGFVIFSICLYTEIRGFDRLGKGSRKRVLNITRLPR
jgi:hypothetical protein